LNKIIKTIVANEYRRE